MEEARVAAHHRCMGSCTVALLTVSANGSLASDEVGAHLIAHCRAAKHRVVERDLVRDDQEAIEVLVDWVADLDTNVVIVTGAGERALSVLLNYGQRVTGFAELAVLAVSESLGSAALHLHADAIRTNGKLVIALAGSTAAMRVVVDCVVGPQLEGENPTVRDSVARPAVEVPRHITTEQLMTFGDLPAVTQPVSLSSPAHAKGRSLGAIIAMVAAGAAAGLVFTATHGQRTTVSSSQEAAPPTVALNTPPQLPTPSFQPTTTQPTTTKPPTTTTTKPPTATTTKPTTATSTPTPTASKVRHTMQPARPPAKRGPTSQTATESEQAEDLPMGMFDACTEERCVAINYARECCTPFKNALSEVPLVLDRTMVANAMSSIASAIDDCAASGAQGTVKVFIRVKPDGTSSGVEVRQSPDETLGRCVADAVRGAQFRATIRGGAFTKSFTF